MTVYISDAARTLSEMLSDKDADFKEYSQRIKGLEHACDELTSQCVHTSEQVVYHAFSTARIFT